MKLNFSILKKSKKPAKVGDVFVYQMLSGIFQYGRVVSITAKVGLLSDCLLLYFYKGTSKIKENLPELMPEAYLVPPMLTDLVPWRRGYFETIAHIPLKEEDTLPVHCFFNPPFQKYVNEYNVELPGKTEPCGFAGFSGIGSIDEDISEALGIPLAED